MSEERSRPGVGDSIASDPIVGEQGGALTFRVLVGPRASRSRFGPVSGDQIKIAVTAPPVGGKANAAVVELVAKTLGVRKADVTLVSGQRGKRKVLRVSGVTRRQLLSAVL